MEKMLSNIKFLRDNKYINDIEYSNFKSWILEDKSINNQEYLETLSCWMIEGIINKKEYFTYIKEIWGKEISCVENKESNYIYSYEPYCFSQNIFLNKNYIYDKRVLALSVISLITMILLTIWLISIIK